MMILENLLDICLFATLLIPFLFHLWVGAGTLLPKAPSESTLAKHTKFSYISYLIITFSTIFLWIILGAKPTKLDLGVLYQNHDYTFPICLYIDLTSSVFLAMTAIISNVITFYSHRYLHRDPGYHRFFYVISLFVFGLNLIFTAGNLDLLFAGWEIVGFSSFLLVSFYWYRPQAVINANRAYFIYRICDLGLLLAAWMTHVLWRKNNIFFDLTGGRITDLWTHVPLWEQWCMGGLILFAVLGKSAQFPFSFWLPRAMEGPTPSSAIFYGSLSIHAGVFLLLRTFSIWHGIPGFPWVVGSFGLLTVGLAVLFGRVQTNIKGQIGYGSIAQVGIMLVELALGFPFLVLIHFVGNASLRCFQLLISPSIVAQQLQIQNSLDYDKLKSLEAPGLFEQFFPVRIRSSLYLFAINEGFLEPILKSLFVAPFFYAAHFANRFYLKLRNKNISEKFDNSLGRFHQKLFRTKTTYPAASSSFFNLVVFVTPWIIAFNTNGFENSDQVHSLFYGFLLFLILLFSFASLGEAKNTKRALNLVVSSNFLVILALIAHNREIIWDASLYLLGIFFSWILSANVLSHVLRNREIQPLNRYSGLLAQFPCAGNLFLIGISGLLGFPLTVTFLGEDLVLHHALDFSLPLSLIFSFVFVINGISLIRLYAHIFLGRRDAEIQNYSCDLTPMSSFVRLFLFILCNAVPFGLKHYFLR